MESNPTESIWASVIPEKEIRDQLDSKNLDPKYFNYIGKDEESLLQLAVGWRNSLECVEYLLSLKFDPNHLNDRGESSLHYAVSRFNQCCVEMTDCLIKNGADINIKSKLDGYAPLHISAGWNKEIKVTELLVEAGANLDAQDNDGNTPLHLISWESRSLETEKYLLKKGANPDIRNKHGQLYSKTNRSIR